MWYTAVSLASLVVALIVRTECQRPTEYTAQRLTSSERCLEPCTRSRDGYYYCEVSRWGDWDYCSPHQGSARLVSKTFTQVNGPCKTDCTSIYRSGFRCESYWGYSDACDPRPVEYYQTYNHQGAECVGPCDKHNASSYYTSYYWCYDSNRRVSFCSPYHTTELGQNLNHLMTNIPRCYSNTCRSAGSNRPRRQVNPYCPADTRNPGSILAYVAAIVALGTVGQLVSVQRPNDPIYRYAYLNLTQTGGPILPLFISARITSNSIMAQGSRDNRNSTDLSRIERNLRRMGKHTRRGDRNNDDNGHLIAYQNGGPDEEYNFAPQSRSLNQGIQTPTGEARQSHWRRAEDSINSWVRGGNGYVDQTVVVVYENYQTNPRPVGFAQHVIYYHTNGAVRYECDDFYSNDPGDEPSIQDELK